MPRTENLFAISGAALFVAGLLVAKFLRHSGGMSITWPGSMAMYVVPSNALCYAVAALFGAFASLYAVGYIPFGENSSKWHFWLSLLGATLFGSGFGALAFLGHRGPDLQPSQGALAVVLVLLVAGPAAFGCGQVLFAVSLSRALVEMHRR
jgi:hypothetical protein